MTADSVGLGLDALSKHITRFDLAGEVQSVSVDDDGARVGLRSDALAGVLLKWAETLSRVEPYAYWIAEHQMLVEVGGIAGGGTRIRVSGMASPVPPEFRWAPKPWTDANMVVPHPSRAEISLGMLRACSARDGAAVGRSEDIRPHLAMVRDHVVAHALAGNLASVLVFSNCASGKLRSNRLVPLAGAALDWAETLADPAVDARRCRGVEVTVSGHLGDGMRIDISGNARDARWTSWRLPRNGRAVSPDVLRSWAKVT